MPVQGARPTVKTRPSGIIRNIFGALGGVTSSSSGSSNSNAQSAANADNDEVVERLTGDELVLTRVGRYGFPYQATCLAVDPLQKILAIGTAHGAIRLCGKPGVECHVRHTSNAAVVQLLFLINEGGLVSACDDASLHLWNLRQAQPVLIQSLQFNKEKISCIRVPYTSKWLYVGTEKGNVYMVCVETFKISGYVIYWNNATPLSCRTHPGPVVHIDSNPVDNSKLLLTYESGLCILWDLRCKTVQERYTMAQATQQVTCTCWHFEGKQFMTGHWDGSTSTWNSRNCKKPEETVLLHGSKQGPTCCPVTKLMWLGVKEGDPCIVMFSGGLAQGNSRKGLTLMRGRSKMLLLSDYVIDFACMVDTPWQQDYQNPQIVIALLKNEIVVFDLSTLPAPSLPWFEIPYTFGIHDSPITCIQYYPECPADLIPALHRFSTSSQKAAPSGFSKQKWPITGGEIGEVSYEPALLVTGHADGGCRFWDVSASTLYLVYQLNVGDLHEKIVTRSDSISSEISKGSNDLLNEEPFAIQHINLCTRSRVLAVGTLSNSVIVYRFRTKETAGEIAKVDVNFGIELGLECDDSSIDSAPTSPADHLNSSADSSQLKRNLNNTASYPTVKSSVQKWSPGFQPELVSQQIANEPAPYITCIALSSAYGLVSFGNALGVAIVDYVQKKTVATMMTYELGEMGDISDTPPESAKTLKSLMSPEPELSDKPDFQEAAKEKRKDRSSRFFGSTSESKDHKETKEPFHPKLTKRLSSRSNGREKEKYREKTMDREDGMFHKELPMAGVVTKLNFTYTYTRKGANIIVPSLWIGTSTGSVSVVALSLPSNGEQRTLQPVLATNTGTQINMKSSVLSINFMDKNGCLFPSPFEFWKDSDDSKSNLSTLPTFTIESSERHLVILISERKIKVKSLPTMKTVSKTKESDSAFFFLKAEVLEIEGCSCVCVLTSIGSLRVYSLPSLRLLMDNDCRLSTSDYRVFRTFRFGKGGEAVYLTSPTEIQRIALTKKKQKEYIEGYGSLFTVVAAPEPPQKSFFQSIFSNTPSPIDTEELFGERKAGSASKSVAAHVKESGLRQLRGDAGSVIGAVAQAKMKLDERGQKLSQLEDKAVLMREGAANFSSNAHELAEKMRGKKWWQL